MRTRRLAPCLPILATAILAAPCLAGTVVIDGVEHVRNEATPRDGVQDLQLTELWRAGGEGDDLFFGLVPRVAVGPDGSTYVLDSQTCQVYVYDRDGALQRTLFREGEGPGEVLRPRDMVLMGDGRVGLIQEFPGAISFVHGDGTPAGRLDLMNINGAVLSLTGCDAAGGVLLVSGTHINRSDRPGIQARVNTLESCGPDGTIMARYAENATVYDFGDFHFREPEHLPMFWFAFAAAPDGRVFTASDPSRYAIAVHAPDGTLQRVIERDYQPLKRTDAEVKRIENMILSAFNGAPFQPTLVIERDESALSYFHRPIQRRDDGELWVLSGRGVRPAQEGVMAVFDVFDDAGVFVRQAALHADHDARDVGIFLAGNDRVLVVLGYLDSLAAQFGNGTAVADEGAEPQAPEVVCYRLD